MARGPTQGPWEVRRAGSRLYIYGANNRQLAAVSFDSTEDEANAHLMGAAPMLLEALQQALERMRQMEEFARGERSALPVSVAAIALAEKALEEADGRAVPHAAS